MILVSILYERIRLNIYITKHGAVLVNPVSHEPVGLIDRTQVINLITKQEAAKAQALVLLSPDIAAYHATKTGTKLILKIPASSPVIKAMNGHEANDSGGPSVSIKIDLPPQIWFFSITEALGKLQLKDCKFGLMKTPLDSLSTETELYSLKMSNVYQGSGQICWGTSSTRDDEKDPGKFARNKVQLFYMTGFNNHVMPWGNGKTVIDNIREMQKIGHEGFYGSKIGKVKDIWNILA